MIGGGDFRGENCIPQPLTEKHAMLYVADVISYTIWSHVSWLVETGTIFKFQQTAGLEITFTWYFFFQ